MTEHVTNVAPEGEKFRVTCERGCNLGSSSLADTPSDANKRADFHFFAQTFLPILEDV